MTGNENLTLDRIVGRLEKAVAILEDRIPEMAASIELDRKERQLECARHWGVTNALAQDLSAANTAHKTIEAEAKNARETIIAEAAAAAARIASESIASAEAKASREAVIAEAVAAAAKTAVDAVTTAAKAARETIVAETTAHRTQRHWLIERGLPVVYAVIGAGLSWLIMLLSMRGTP